MPRDGKREKSGRPLLNKNEGKRIRHDITIPETLWKRLKVRALKENISVSQLIERYCSEKLGESYDDKRP